MNLSSGMSADKSADASADALCIIILFFPVVITHRQIQFPFLPSNHYSQQDTMSFPSQQLLLLGSQTFLSNYYSQQDTMSFPAQQSLLLGRCNILFYPVVITHRQIHYHFLPRSHYSQEDTISFSVQQLLLLLIARYNVLSYIVVITPRQI